MLAACWLLPVSTPAAAGWYGGEVPVHGVRVPGHLPVPDQLIPRPGSLKGRFLVASRHMKDPRFRESVILVVQHGTGGSMGLIINKPTTIGLSRAFPGIRGLDDGAFVYFGGPVELKRMFLLVRAPSDPGESVHVFDSVFISTSSALLERLAAGRVRSGDFRIYAGYAGWAAGQLENEIARGDWHVVAADPSVLFDEPPADVWPRLISRFTGLQVRGDMLPGAAFSSGRPAGFSVIISHAPFMAMNDMEEGP